MGKRVLFIQQFETKYIKALGYLRGYKTKCWSQMTIEMLVVKARCLQRAPTVGTAVTGFF